MMTRRSSIEPDCKYDLANKVDKSVTSPIVFLVRFWVKRPDQGTLVYGKCRLADLLCINT